MITTLKMKAKVNILKFCTITIDEGVCQIMLRCLCNTVHLYKACSFSYQSVQLVLHEQVP